MACENSNAALRGPAHPTANPGYGKRTVPAEPGTAASRAVADFSHLPAREAYIAAFVDRLPDGAAMDIKSLAKVLPLYGQQAVRSALNALSRAGHLHRARGLAATGDSGTRWVFRTYWSRTAHDDAWWAAFLDGGEAPDITQDEGRDVPAPACPPVAHVNPTPDHSTPSTDAPAEPHATTAHRVLARLGTVDPRLALSAADCDALTDLVVPWLERGASTVTLVQALTAGLPDAVHAPRGFVACRLRDKLPPLPVPTPVPAAFDEQPAPYRPRRLMPECTECGVPGRPAAFVGGLCRGCRTATPTPTATATASRGAPAAAPHAASQPRRQSAAVLAREALVARDRRQSAKSRPVTARQPS